VIDNVDIKASVENVFAEKFTCVSMAVGQNLFAWGIDLAEGFVDGAEHVVTEADLRKYLRKNLNINDFRATMSPLR
jgi:hypothetical protein